MRNLADARLGDIKRVVKDTLSADFESVRILDVSVHSDLDTDGDEILRIEVLFDGKPKDIDARKVAGAVRQLRPRLSEISEAFPLLSFISRSDLGRTTLEPA